MPYNVTTDVNQLADGLLIDGYDQVLNYELRSNEIYQQFVDVHPQNPTNRSRTVHLKRWDYLPRGTRLVSEEPDPTGLLAPETIDVPVTLDEYGAVVGRTFLLDNTTYVEIDPYLARVMSLDAIDTMDELARDTFLLTTNTATATGADDYDTAGTVGTVTATDLLAAKTVRRAVRDLRTRNVMPWRDGAYVALVSPEVAMHFREENGGAGWYDPHSRVDTAGIYNGEIGKFEGAIFVESNRAHRANDGATAAEAHRTLFLGRQGVASAVVKAPSAGIAPIIDKFSRHREIVWHAFLGHAVYRHEAIQLVYSGVGA